MSLGHVDTQRRSMRTVDREYRFALFNVFTYFRQVRSMRASLLRRNSARSSTAPLEMIAERARDTFIAGWSHDDRIQTERACSGSDALVWHEERRALEIRATLGTQHCVEIAQSFAARHDDTIDRVAQPRLQ